MLARSEGGGGSCTSLHGRDGDEGRRREGGKEGVKENFPFEGDEGRGRLEMQCGSSLGHMLQLPWMLELAAKVRETFEAGKLNNGEEERVTQSDREISRYEPHYQINKQYDHLCVIVR